MPESLILEPLLFLLYINDLQINAFYFEITLFADDINLNLCHNNTNFLQSFVQYEISKISEWIISNNLILNYKKVVICW